MPDKYSSFKALADGERLDIDYGIVPIDKATKVAIFAPHGGWIEPGTSEIVQAIAGDALSQYRFEGLKRGRPHGDLHITSTKFDEPEALRLANASRTVVAIHGRANDNDEKTIWMGGLDVQLRDAIQVELIAAGFAAKAEGHHLTARDQLNICNKGSSKAGVQLELPRTLRDALRIHPEQLHMFASAVRRAIDRA